MNASSLDVHALAERGRQPNRTTISQDDVLLHAEKEPGRGWPKGSGGDGERNNGKITGVPPAGSGTITTDARSGKNWYVGVWTEGGGQCC